MVLFFSGNANAQAIASSARQLEPGSWKVIPYFQGTADRELTFSLESTGPCAGGGGVNPAFPCGSAGKVTAEVDGSAALAQLLVQPWDRVQYFVVGGAGKLRLSLPGGSVATGEGFGHIAGLGVRAQIMPDTVVSPAIAFSLSAGWQQYRFDTVQPSATPAIDQKLDIYQYQAALEVAHRFEFKNTEAAVEPYGGVRWTRSHSYLKDQRNAAGGSRIGGMKDTFSPFLGLQVPVFERETIFAEASFIDGVQYAAGLQVRFK